MTDRDESKVDPISARLHELAVESAERTIEYWLHQLVAYRTVGAGDIMHVRIARRQIAVQRRWLENR